MYIYSFDKFKKSYFKKRFPNIYANFNNLGYDLPFERVPISPAFHYAMGGIATQINAKVKTMKTFNCNCVS